MRRVVVVGHGMVGSRFVEELVGADLDRARARTEAVFGTTRQVLKRAETESVTPLAAAIGQAQDRIDEARRAAEDGTPGERVL